MTRTQVNRASDCLVATEPGRVPGSVGLKNTWMSFSASCQEPVGLQGNRLQINPDGAYLTAFSGNRACYYPAKAAKSAHAQLNFRYDS